MAGVERGGPAQFRSRLPLLRALQEVTPDAYRRGLDILWVNVGAPWVMNRAAFDQSLTKEDFVRVVEATRPSVLPRQGTSFSHPLIFRL